MKTAPSADFPRPIATVDVVAFRLEGGRLLVGTVERAEEPHRGRPALPGGFVRPEEDASVEAAALRVMAQKAAARPSWLEQLGVFSGRGRDERGWSLSVAFVALFCDDPGPGLAFHDADAVPALPFDHERIVAAALSRVRSKAGYSSLPLRFLPDVFTVPQAHAVYEATLNVMLDKAAFRRKFLESGLVEDTGETTRPAETGAKSSRLYRMRGEGLGFVPRNFAAPR